jgi:hypothetical protein
MLVIAAVINTAAKANANNLFMRVNSFIVGFPLFAIA